MFLDFINDFSTCNKNPDEQRLIYSGRLLVDGEFLKDFLRDLESEETHTLHLVYTSKNQTEVSSPPTMTDVCNYLITCK